MRTKYHYIAAALGFLLAGMSVYYGTRIWDANQNHLITGLNEFDRIYHDDVKIVPKLSAQAVVITMPFVLGILICELLILRKVEVKQVRNIAIGLLGAIIIVIGLDVFTLSDPAEYDFSKFGFISIFMGMIIMAGNLLSVAVYRFRRPKSQ